MTQIAKKISKKDKENVVLSPIEILQSTLDNNPGDHFNNLKMDSQEVDYKISTGSITLDRELGGGLGSGVHRFIGVREGGKTSCSLTVAKNFLDHFKEKGYVFYYKGEGRLDQDLKVRMGFSDEDKRFQVIKSNIYEFVIDSMRSLVKNCRDTKSGDHFLFIIDSIDGLITREEMEKTAEQAAQVGSSARMLSLMLKKISAAFSEYGHMGIFISQERSNITINPYAPKDQKQGNSSGGNAIQHYANMVLNFKQRNKDDLIFEGDDDKGEIIGHYCKVVLLKTTNDNTLAEVRYPIKRRKGVWKELEVADFCLEWGVFKKEKSSYIFNIEELNKSDEFAELFALYKDKIPESLVGEKKFKSFFTDSENAEVVNYLYNLFRKTLVD